MDKFCEVFGDHQLDELTVDDIMDFLNQLTDGPFKNNNIDERY